MLSRPPLKFNYPAKTSANQKTTIEPSYLKLQGREYKNANERQISFDIDEKKLYISIQSIKDEFYLHNIKIQPYPEHPTNYLITSDGLKLVLSQRFSSIVSNLQEAVNKAEERKRMSRSSNSSSISMDSSNSKITRSPFLKEKSPEITKIANKRPITHVNQENNLKSKLAKVSDDSGRSASPPITGYESPVAKRYSSPIKSSFPNMDLASISPTVANSPLVLSSKLNHVESEFLSCSNVKKTYGKSIPGKLLSAGVSYSSIPEKVSPPMKIAPFTVGNEVYKPTSLLNEVKDDLLKEKSIIESSISSGERTKDKQKSEKSYMHPLFARTKDFGKKSFELPISQTLINFDNEDSRSSDNDNNKEKIESLHLPPLTENNTKQANFMKTFFESTPTIATTPKLFIKGGIRNIGNSCFISSTMQALFSLQCIMHDINSSFWNKLIVRLLSDDNIQATWFESTFYQSPDSEEKKNKLAVLNEFQSLYQTKLNLTPVDSTRSSTRLTANDFALSIKSLKEAMGIANPIYASYSQQDAQEFLSDLINYMNDAMLVALQASIAELSKNNNSFLSSIFSPISSFSSSTKVDQSSNNLRGFLKLSPSDQNAILSPLLPTTYYCQSSMEMQFTCTKCQFKHPLRQEYYRDFSIDLPDPDLSGNTQDFQYQEPFTVADSSSNGYQIPFFQSITQTFSIDSNNNDRTDLLPSKTNEKPVHLNNLIDLYLQNEIRELSCPKCHDNNLVKISKAISDLSPILIFHLKRFRYDSYSQEFIKIDSPVVFPTIIDHSSSLFKYTNPSATERFTSFDSSYEQLWNIHKKIDVNFVSDLLEFAGKNKSFPSNQSSNSSNNCKYRLKAVVRHLGKDMTNGHYLCDVNSPETVQKFLDSSDDNSHESKQWIRFNDSTATAIDEEMVLKDCSTPYLLFYERDLK